jgi:hypothetical protein
MLQGKPSAELRTEAAQALLRQIDLKPVPAGVATIGLEDALAAKFTRSYGEDWHEFYHRETPQHTIAVGAFDLARYPVTNGLYAQFIAAGGYSTPEYWTPEGWAWRQDSARTAPLFWNDPKFAGDDRPVVGVSWYEAVAFTRWASATTGRAIRLPTEIEWEWAARGENIRWLYPWGGTFNPDRLNSGVEGISGETAGKTIPVGTYLGMATSLGRCGNGNPARSPRIRTVPTTDAKICIVRRGASCGAGRGAMVNTPTGSRRASTIRRTTATPRQASVSLRMSKGAHRSNARRMIWLSMERRRSARI